ncbi:DNA polymerase alpha catalytic subunit [Tanacetum coccineum]
MKMYLCFEACENNSKESSFDVTRSFDVSSGFLRCVKNLFTCESIRREILQQTVDLVQNNLNFEVIYGDTDLIMIYTRLDDINKAKPIKDIWFVIVNKKFKCLEIDLDGLYKRMLLLKKKKYAAVKEQTKDGSCEEVVEFIHEKLMKVQEDMRNGKIALEKYIITKSLNKPPEAYPDA